MGLLLGQVFLMKSGHMVLEVCWERDSCRGLIFLRELVEGNGGICKCLGGGHLIGLHPCLG